jgi:hypothetical protein
MSVLAVPSGLLITVLRALPRDAVLRLRLACRAMCARVSALLACRDVGFRRTLRVHGPEVLVARTVRSLLARFGPGVRAWEIRVDPARFLALAAALDDPESFRVALDCKGCASRALVALDADTRDLRGTAAFRSLTELDLASASPAASLVYTIARLGGMRRLTSLDISWARSEHGLVPSEALLGPGALGAGLTTLRLRSTGLTTESWPAIAASLSPARTELDLSSNPVGSRALAPSLAPFLNRDARGVAFDPGLIWLGTSTANCSNWTSTLTTAPAGLGESTIDTRLAAWGTFDCAATAPQKIKQRRHTQTEKRRQHVPL